MKNNHLSIQIISNTPVIMYCDFFVQNIIDNMNWSDYEYFLKMLHYRYAPYGQNVDINVPVNAIAHCLPKKIRNEYFIYDSSNSRFVIKTDMYLMLMRY